MTYFEGLHVIMSINIIFPFLKISFVSANSANHFIWVSAACHSSNLGISSPQRVNKQQYIQYIRDSFLSLTATHEYIHYFMLYILLLQ